MFKAVISPPTTFQNLLKVLSDPTRLRILGLVELEELSVGELSRALGMTQSRVSNHLRVLREEALLRERHVGTSTHLRPDLDSGQNGRGDYPARLWATLREGLISLPEHAADRSRLQQVLAARSSSSPEFFDRMAGEWDKIGAQFATGQARQRAIASLLPGGLKIADLGCGTGYMARALVGLAGHLVCVDRSEGMLDQARRRLDPAPPGVEIEFRRGELDALPIEPDELDGTVAGMVLHHLADLDPALREMQRVVRPGGTAIVLELAPHRESWMHEAQGDRHLGLNSSDVVAAFRRAGFVDVTIESVEDRYCPKPPNADDGATPIAPGKEASLPLYIVRGRVAPQVN